VGQTIDFCGLPRLRYRNCLRYHKYAHEDLQAIRFAVPMSRVVRGGFPDRRFDVDFWQRQGDEAIFEAAGKW
jgi:hypothetical protein